MDKMLKSGELVNELIQAGASMIIEVDKNGRSRSEDKNSLDEKFLALKKTENSICSGRISAKSVFLSCDNGEEARAKAVLGSLALKV